MFLEASNCQSISLSLRLPKDELYLSHPLEIIFTHNIYTTNTIKVCRVKIVFCVRSGDAKCKNETKFASGHIQDICIGSDSAGSDPSPAYSLSL